MPRRRKGKRDRLEHIDKVRFVVLMNRWHEITREYVASKLKLDKSDISFCFQQLNLDGILSKGHNFYGGPPHDEPTRYTILIPRDERMAKLDEYFNTF